MSRTPNNMNDKIKVHKHVLDAWKRINNLVYCTPLARSLWLEDENSTGKVFLKLESEQVTGSFKARGAMNKVLTLNDEEKNKGLITASTGNHALAVTHAAQTVGQGKIKFEIVLPETASKAKVDLLKRLGAPVRFFGKDCLLAETDAIRDAKENGKTYISPYNDLEILAGQGTIGIEIINQLPVGHQLDAVFIPVGGGGLIAGIASYVKFTSPETKIFGCCPKNDAHMARSISAGHLINDDSYLENNGETLSEGTAGAVEQESITFDICKTNVDEWLEISEQDIGQAVVDMLDKGHKAIEGSAGLGIAGYRYKQKDLLNKNVAIVICGGNVKATAIKDLLNKYL